LSAAPSSLRALGLTGGIGSGKSTVAKMLEDLGAWLVDTDAIARALTQAGGAAMPALQAAFGPQAPNARRRLEVILHPLISQEAQRQASEAAGRPVVFDVPLLTESSHWRARVCRVLVVDCLESTQVARVAQRPGWDEAAARRVVAQQASRAARRGMADAVIFNDGIAMPTLHAEVGTLWRAWMGDTSA